MKPIISVVMPVYNAEKYLDRSIQSILSQSLTDFELIIINDGSTDQSEEVIKHYSDERIVYIKNENNQRIVNTLNRGIAAARGEYIARMDADDIALPFRFQQQVAEFLKNPNLDVVSSRIFFTTDGNEKIKTIMYQSGNTNAIRFICFFETPIPHPNVMIKANCLKKFKYLADENLNFIEDYDLWARMLFDGRRIKNIRKRSLKYRISSNGICHGNMTTQIKNSVLYSKQLIISNLNLDVDAELIEMIKLREVKGGFHSIFKCACLIKRCYSVYKIKYKLSINDCFEIYRWIIIRVCVLFLKNILVCFHNKGKQ